MKLLPAEKEAVKKILFKRIDELQSDSLAGTREFQEACLNLYKTGRALEKSENAAEWFDSTDLDVDSHDKIKAILESVLFASALAVVLAFGREKFDGHTKIGIALAEMFWLAFANERAYLADNPNLVPASVRDFSDFHQRDCMFYDFNSGIGFLLDYDNGKIHIYSAKVRDSRQKPSHLLTINLAKSDPIALAKQEHPEAAYRTVALMRGALTKYYGTKPLEPWRAQFHEAIKAPCPVGYEIARRMTAGRKTPTLGEDVKMFPEQVILGELLFLAVKKAGLPFDFENSTCHVGLHYTISWQWKVSLDPEWLIILAYTGRVSGNNIDSYDTIAVRMSHVGQTERIIKTDMEALRRAITMDVRLASDEAAWHAAVNDMAEALKDSLKQHQDAPTEKTADVLAENKVQALVCRALDMAEELTKTINKIRHLTKSNT